MRPSIFTTDFGFDLLVAGFRIGGQGIKGEKKQQRQMTLPSPLLPPVQGITSFLF